MHTSYAAYAKSLSAAELAQELRHAKRLATDSPMCQALLAEAAARQERV